MQLTLAAYEQAEGAAIARLSNRAVEVFQPTHFNRVGYPTRVREFAEVMKYAEVMHEGETASHVTALGALTDEEWKAVSAITRDVWALSSGLGSPTLPRASLLGALHVLRLIQRIYGDKRPRIFELGPGTGYLGALLSRLEYPYAAMDVTEGFYLYQNACWNVTAPNGVAELALAPACPPEALESLTPGTPVHIPWWHFASLKPTLQNCFDLIVCNRALCEMNSIALQFSLRVGRAFLAGTSPVPNVPKAFLFDGWGAEVVSRPTQVLQAFLQAGYEPAYLDDSRTTGVFVPRRSGGRFDRRAMDDATDVIRYGQEQHAFSIIRHIFAKTIPNQISDVLSGSTDSGSVPRTHGAADLEGLWREVSGSPDHRTRDEVFWDAASFPSFLADALPGGRPIYLFGSGALGQRVRRDLEDLGRLVCAFLDNDRSKWGQRVAGLMVQDPTTIPTNAAVLVTTAYWREVSVQLASAGLVEGSDFFVFPELS